VSPVRCSVLFYCIHFIALSVPNKTITITIIKVCGSRLQPVHVRTRRLWWARLLFCVLYTNHDVEGWHPTAEQEVPDVDTSVHLGDVHDGWSGGTPVRVWRILHHRSTNIQLPLNTDARHWQSSDRTTQLIAQKWKMEAQLRRGKKVLIYKH